MDPFDGPAIVPSLSKRAANNLHSFAYALGVPWRDFTVRQFVDMHSSPETPPHVWAAMGIVSYREIMETHGLGYSEAAFLSWKNRLRRFRRAS